MQVISVNVLHLAMALYKPSEGRSVCGERAVLYNGAAPRHATPISELKKEIKGNTRENR